MYCSDNKCLVDAGAGRTDGKAWVTVNNLEQGKGDANSFEISGAWGTTVCVYATDVVEGCEYYKDLQMTIGQYTDLSLSPYHWASFLASYRARLLRPSMPIADICDRLGMSCTSIRRSLGFTLGQRGEQFT